MPVLNQHRLKKSTSHFCRVDIDIGSNIVIANPNSPIDVGSNFLYNAIAVLDIGSNIAYNLADNLFDIGANIDYHPEGMETILPVNMEIGTLITYPRQDMLDINSTAQYQLYDYNLDIGTDIIYIPESSIPVLAVDFDIGTNIEDNQNYVIDIGTMFPNDDGQPLLNVGTDIFYPVELDTLDIGSEFTYPYNEAALDIGTVFSYPLFKDLLDINSNSTYPLLQVDMLIGTPSEIPISSPAGSYFSFDSNDVSQYRQISGGILTFDSDVATPSYRGGFMTFNSEGIIAGSEPRDPTIWNAAFNLSATITNSGKNASLGHLNAGHTRTIFGTDIGGDSNPWYVELTSHDIYAMMGISRSDVSSSSNIYHDNSSRTIAWFAHPSYQSIYFNNAVIENYSVPSGLTIGILLAPTTGNVWFYNGVSLSGPHTLDISSNNTFHIAVSSGASAGTVVTLNCGQDPFIYTPPAGSRTVFGPLSV